MPLPPATARRLVHHRTLNMNAYAREDGGYDVEGHLIDNKPNDFLRPSSLTPLPAGEPLHDLWVRMTLDNDYVVRDIAAASDVTPWDICKQAEGTLRCLVGERVARGWSALVKQRLRGAVSCTHLMEMLIPLATTAHQAILAAKLQQPPVLLHQIDSCYAYGRDREVVQRVWFELHPRGEG